MRSGLVFGERRKGGHGNSESRRCYLFLKLVKVNSSERTETYTKKYDLRRGRA